MEPKVELPKTQTGAGSPLDKITGALNSALKTAKTALGGGKKKTAAKKPAAKKPAAKKTAAKKTTKKTAKKTTKK